MRPLKDLFMHELLNTGSPEPPTPTPSGNVITGTFKATANGNLLVPLSLPQNSYPLSVQIFPENGYNAESEMSSANNNTIISSSLFKTFPDLVPTYDPASANDNDRVAYANVTKTRGGTVPFYPADDYSSSFLYFFNQDDRTNVKWPLQFDGSNLLIRTATSPSSSAYKYATNVTYKYVVTYK